MISIRVGVDDCIVKGRQELEGIMITERKDAD